jgi:5'-deoxynucleotidase YfbR-like HD superfamily hydrolase
MAMTLASQVIERYPLRVKANELQRVLANLEARSQTYENIIKKFEAEHGCDLETFEKKMQKGELPEHPSWETSIEWGVAIDELEKLRVIKEALEWTLNFLS